MGEDLGPLVISDPKLSEREKKRLRNARARRKLERLREEKALRRWLTDVWDETSSD